LILTDKKFLSCWRRSIRTGGTTSCISEARYIKTVNTTGISWRH